ncbi:hypothetical protein [Bacteroides acidifaciens]|uniref:hypothetical protein n=1 Tax=Bacteroides acidifaciens TaxID=85831 RepID=UPI0025B5D84C|nr:hypothetical protein [Bacteroides acidifaciens]
MEVAVSGVQEEKRGGAGRTVKKQIKSKSSRREKISRLLLFERIFFVALWKI